MDWQFVRSLLESNESFAETVVLAGALVVVLPLVRAFGPRTHAHSYRALGFFAAHTLCYLGALALHAAGLTQSAEWLHGGQHLFAAFTVVALAGYLVFDVALPLLAIEVVALTYELVVGLGYLVAAFLIFGGLGVDLTNVLAASTIAAAILSISLQNTLGNVVGGVALQLDGSFTVGDWLQLENGRQGCVRQIRWRHTVFETRDGDTVIVPNAYLLATQLTLLGRRRGVGHPHRIALQFQVDVHWPPDAVCDTVIHALRGAPIPNVLADPPPDCVCLDLAMNNRDGFVVYVVRYFIDDLWADEATSSRVRGRIHAALSRAEIPLGRPSMQIVHQSSVDFGREQAAGGTAAARAVVIANGLFEALTTEEVDLLAGSMHRVCFSPGERITRQGDEAHHLYLLASGEVNVTREGESEPVAHLSAPDFFGEMGLLTGEPRQAHVDAATSVVCWRVDREPFHRLLLGRPDLAEAISARVAQRRLRLSGAAEAERHAPLMAREEARLLARIRQFFRLES